MGNAAIRVAGLAVAAGLFLAGCTGSAPDVTPSSGPTSASPSASPSPSLPVRPERPQAMKRNDAEGAAAAAEYFIELYPYVMATGDTEEFEAMSHRACGFCEDALEQAERIADGGYAYSGGDTNLTVITTYARDELTGIYPLDVEISQKSSLISDGDGEEIHAVKDKDSESRIEMGLRKNDWVVVAVAPIPEAGK